MDYQIKHITSEQELDNGLAFIQKTFGVSSGQYSPMYSREKWLERMTSYSDLMLLAEAYSEVIGIVFGRVENENSVTVGPVAIDEHFRQRGLAKEMMLLLEQRALNHGRHHLWLGAVESAEGFYRRLGYKSTLLIQSQKHGIDELLSLNSIYSVIKTNVYDRMISQVYLDLPVSDRELQREYESTFPGCHTQMIFSKTIGVGGFEHDKQEHASA